MNNSIFTFPKKLIEELPNLENSLDYDYQIYRLSFNFESNKFLVINPMFDQNELPDLEMHECEDTKLTIWKSKDNWIAKYFTKEWIPSRFSYKEININFIEERIWKINPDLDQEMLFSGNIYREYQCSSWDRKFKLVWYLDPRVNPLKEKIWAFSSEPKHGIIEGEKHMGYVMPSIEIKFNKHIPNVNINVDDYYPPFWELEYENVYYLDPLFQAEEDTWCIKYSPKYKKNKLWRSNGFITPNVKIEYNPVLGELDYDLDYQILWHDLQYEHIWLLDKNFLHDGEDDIWAFKISYTDNPTGTKIVDYISPKLNVEYNKILPKLNYTVDYKIYWHDLQYEHIWLLDKNFLHDGEDDIWAIKYSYVNNPKGTTIIDYISPKLNIKYNKILPKLNYTVDYKIYWHDLQYEHMWLLDRQHMNDGEDDIWAIKYSYVNNPKGTTIIDYITPDLTIEYNNDLYNINKNVNYSISWYELKYEHIFTLDDPNFDNVWVTKIRATDKVKGQKYVGKIKPLIKNLDVIFISYNEPNAEENWNRLLEKAPWAKRVNGVKGIFNAHKAAAKLSTSDMFYVVDGDAYLEKDWDFSFQPNIFDRDCAYVWSSKNPINDLVYGYGGVKLFPKKIIINQRKLKTLDMFSCMPKIKVEEKISCITKFNVDEFSTWRSAFRECVKLYINGKNKEINQWLTKGKNRKFGKYAIKGAEDAVRFARRFQIDNDMLSKINDYDWLKSVFEKSYKNK